MKGNAEGGMQDPLWALSSDWVRIRGQSSSSQPYWAAVVIWVVIMFRTGTWDGEFELVRQKKDGRAD